MFAMRDAQFAIRGEKAERPAVESVSFVFLFVDSAHSA
jgi:hypothetical protein